jgi:hypothetical protein
MNRLSRSLCLAATAALLPAAARADAPRDIPFQAAVRTAAGAPLPDAPVSVTFSLYAVSGGAALWTSTQTLTPAHGVISTRLAVPDTVRFDQPYSLGVKIGSDAEMTPRLPLSAAPYALALPNVSVDRPTGAVGIGAPPNPDLPLTVGGVVHSTTGGFQFPDGTVQATAQLVGPRGPAGATGPRGPAGPPGSDASDPGVPTESGLSETTLTLRVDNSTSQNAVSLAQPFEIEVSVVNHSGPTGEPYKTAGPYTFGPLVLHRVADANDPSWMQWAHMDSNGRYTAHEVELTLVNNEGATLAAWDFPNCFASQYKLLPATGTLPVEEITVLPQQMQRVISVAREEVLGPLGPGNVRTLFTVTGFSGQALVTSPVWTEAPVTITSGGQGIPIVQLGTMDTKDVSVVIGLNRVPDLYAWFSDVLRSKVQKRDGSITETDSLKHDLITIPASGVWPSRYSLISTPDGGVVEGYRLTMDDVTRS